MSNKPQQVELFSMPVNQAQEAISGKGPKRRWYYVGHALGGRMLFMSGSAPGYFWDTLSFVEMGPALFNSFKEAQRVAREFGGKVKILPYDYDKLMRWWSGAGPAW